MLKPVVLANAATTVMVSLYVVCRIVSLIAPDFLFTVARSWFHTLSLDSSRGTTPMESGTFLFGLITLSVLVWVTTYATVDLYNRWLKK